MIKSSFPIALALLLCSAVSAEPEVYQCETDGVRVFSDRPCGPDASVHSAGPWISYIEPDENLPAQAEAARAFIERRRQRLARRGESSRSAPATSAPHVDPRSPVYGLPWSTGTHHRHPDWSETPSPPSRAQRYSPLNGPILGTRRSGSFRVRLGDPPDAGRGR